MYLDEKLTFYDDRIVDQEGGCVMMNWETSWMKRSAEIICQTPGDILNIGFGMGIIDTFIQSHNPTTHTIIEAHPDVYDKMIKDGWDKKPGVRIIHSKWQDVIENIGFFDGIYFDTYRDGGFGDTLIPNLPNLLKPNGIFSYWEGRFDKYIDPSVTDLLVGNFDYTFEIHKLDKVPSFKEQSKQEQGYFNEQWTQCVIPIIKHKTSTKRQLF